MIKHQTFVNKHLSVQTQRKVNSKRYSISSNLLIKLPQHCRWRNYRVVIITFRHVLVCTSVMLLFIPLAKWYKKQRFKVQHSNLSNYLLGILRKLQINFFKKNLFGGLLIFLLKQWHSETDKSWFQLQKLGLEGAGCFIL